MSIKLHIRAVRVNGAGRMEFQSPKSKPYSRKRIFLEDKGKRVLPNSISSENACSVNESREALPAGRYHKAHESSEQRYERGFDPPAPGAHPQTQGQKARNPRA